MEGFHHTQGFIISTGEEFYSTLIPAVSIGLVCQEFYDSNIWSDESVTTIYFQIDFSGNYETEIWLEKNGVKSANIHTM